MIDKLPSRFCRSLSEFAIIAEVVMEITRGNISSKEGLSTLDGRFGTTLFSKMSEYEALSFITNHIREGFMLSKSVTDHLIQCNRDHSLDRSKVSTKDL